MKRYKISKPKRIMRTLVCASLLAAASLAGAENPSLSREVARVIEAQGAAVAREWFAEIYPAQKEAFTINTPGLAELASKYMQNGDVEAARAVAWMLDEISSDMLNEALNAGSN